MSINAREGYRDRLSEGDVVYFVDGDRIDGRGDLTVKKGSVSDTTLKSGLPRLYPQIKLWDNLDAEPRGGGVHVGKSPRELFTKDEVLRAILADDGPLSLDDRSVDEMLIDPLAVSELTGVLGGVAISRMADDLVKNPVNDPERP